MKRKASATWQGNLKEGSGELSAESGILLHVPYSFKSRFENEGGVNPEELIAAAHASCFTMALSFELSRLGFFPDSIQSQAAVHIEKTRTGWNITEVNLEASARVPGISDSHFIEVAEVAKSACPVSKLLKARITLDAKLLPSEKGRVAA